MPQQTISISMVGDKADVEALRRTALARGKMIGDLVREALDALYGDEIRQHRAAFVAQNDNRNNQTRKPSNSRRKAKSAQP